MAHNRRITEQLLEYWDGLRGERLYPSFEDLAPEGLESLWPDCFILRIFYPHTMARKPNDFEFTYIGENVIPLFGEEINTPDTLPFPEKVLKHYEEVSLTRKAILDEGEFENMKHELVQYRQILLPLGSTEESVEYILGGIRHKGGGRIAETIGHEAFEYSEN